MLGDSVRAKCTAAIILYSVSTDMAAQSCSTNGHRSDLSPIQTTFIYLGHTPVVVWMKISENPIIENIRNR